jgi:hypothetical protein
MNFLANFLSAWIGGLILRGRFFLGGLGVIVAAAGAWSMYSAAAHSLNGVDTSAVLVERFASCQAEFHPKGESRRKEAMDCDRAYAFQKWAGTKKVKVHKTDHAKVRYTLSDGSSRVASVYEGKVETRGKPVGTTFDAVYDPANPDDVRARPNLGSASFQLMMLAGGLLMVALALLPQVLRLFHRAPAQSATADAAAWGEDALREAIARHQPAPQHAAPVSLPAGKAFGRRPDAPNGVRRQFGVRGT